LQDVDTGRGGGCKEGIVLKGNEVEGNELLSVCYLQGVSAILAEIGLVGVGEGVTEFAEGFGHHHSVSLGEVCYLIERGNISQVFPYA
jgi:hypothetical protein